MMTGWYYCQGDPPGTLRYWDGQQWVGPPRAPAPSPQSSVVHVPGIGTLADPGLRIVARLIDVVILACAIYGINTLIGMFAAERAMHNIAEHGFGGIFGAFNTLGATMILTAIVAVGLSVAYELGFTMHFGGTPGKLAFRFRIVDEHGKTPLNWQPALVRWLPFGVLILVARMPIVAFIGALGLLVLAIVGLVLLLVSPTRQTPWDVLAKTHVVTSEQA